MSSLICLIRCCFRNARSANPGLPQSCEMDFSWRSRVNNSAHTCLLREEMT